jgi:twinkle protein
MPMEEVFDLTVEENSNYYLATNNKPILVHNSGKSEFVDDIICRLNLLHGWKAGIFTPENYPLKYYYAKLHKKISGRKFKGNADDADFHSVFQHINDNFYYILNEDDMTFEGILESAKYLVKQKGIKVFVIDPYNKIEHNYPAGESETKYIGRFLDKLINFSKFNDVLCILIAHPRKMEVGKVPSLYDISGSANFYNKADYGFTVHRLHDDKNLMTNEIEIHFQKIKFMNLGKQGVCELIYNYNNGRFHARGECVDFWDNTNWLIKKNENNVFDEIKEEVPF